MKKRWSHAQIAQRNEEVYSEYKQVRAEQKYIDALNGIYLFAKMQRDIFQTSYLQYIDAIDGDDFIRKMYYAGVLNAYKDMIREMNNLVEEVKRGEKR